MSWNRPTFGKWFLYVLECKGGWFYVGITKDVKRRVSQHRNNIGAEFTKKHKVVRVHETCELGEMTYQEAQKYEDAYTLQLREQKNGKVCGGVYLDDQDTTQRNKNVVKPKYDSLAKETNRRFKWPKRGRKTGVDGKKSLIKKM